MNIENHIANTKNLLDEARDDLLDNNYGHAMLSLASAYSNVRKLMEHVCEVNRAAASAEVHAVDDSGGP